MKKLTYLLLLVALLSFGGCRRHKGVQYIRPPQDSIISQEMPMDESVSTEEDYERVEEYEGITEEEDDEGIFVVPEVPQESDFLQEENRVDVERVMQGKE